MFNYSHIAHTSLNLNDLTRHELLPAMGGRVTRFACDPCAQGGTLVHIHGHFCFSLCLRVSVVKFSVSDAGSHSLGSARLGE